MAEDISDCPLTAEYFIRVPHQTDWLGIGAHYIVRKIGSIKWPHPSRAFHRASCVRSCCRTSSPPPSIRTEFGPRNLPAWDKRGRYRRQLGRKSSSIRIAIRGRKQCSFNPEEEFPMSAQSLRTYRPKADQAISDFQNHGDFQKQQLCSILAGTLWPYLEAGRAWRRPSLRKRERGQTSCAVFLLLAISC